MNRFAEGLKGIKGATGKVSPKAVEVAVHAPSQAVEEAKLAPVPLPPSRQGKVAIAAYFDPAVRKQFAILAVKEEKSHAALLADAINLLFERYGEPPIASA